MADDRTFLHARHAAHLFRCFFGGWLRPRDRADTIRHDPARDPEAYAVSEPATICLMASSRFKINATLSIKIEAVYGF